MFPSIAAMGATATLTRRLDWSDTDAAGYWHHSTFWKYAEAGEAELARQLGLTDQIFGVAPRRSVAAEFHRPVYFDDEVQENLYGVSGGYQLGARYRIDSRAAITLMVEQNFNRIHTTQVRAFALVDLDFFVGTGGE